MFLHINWISTFLNVRYQLSDIWKLSWSIQKFSCHFSETFWVAQKIIHPWTSLSRSNLITWGISFALRFRRFWYGWFFWSLKSWKKSAAMHKYHIYYLSNIRQVLLFFSTRHYENDDRALPDTHWICLNVLLNYEVLIYFLLLLEKVKTAQKISQFSCFHYTSACFYPFVKPNP